MGIPFNQRMGIENSRPVTDQLPERTRVALAHFLSDLKSKDYLVRREDVIGELLRSCRLSGEEFNFDKSDGFESNLPYQQTVQILNAADDWWRVFVFFERAYSRLLKSSEYYDDYKQDWIENTNISDVRKYYVEELNTILKEDNIGYQFVNGQFQRRGRAQTQKNFQQMGTVLSDPALSKVKQYYIKARQAFDEHPEPDVQNCVKDALCALEACLEIVTGKPASRDFPRVVRDLKGNEAREIPPPIAEGMVKLYGYRGSGEGVSHAAINGNRVTEIEAELVLNQIASYITYLVDLFPLQEDEVPF